MVLNRNSVLALFLIVCGGLIVLDQLGLSLGNLLSYLLSYIFHSVPPVAPIAPLAPLAP
jgi:hypothetical protein